MKKYFFYLLIGFGCFFMGYPFGKILHHLVYKDNLFDSTYILYIAIGLIITLLGFWGHKKLQKEDQAENSY